MTTGLGATYRFMGVGPLATPTQLRADLRALGVEPGSVLMVHTALSKVGFIPGGAQAMIEALLDVLGPGGTLVMPAFSASITDPQFWTNPPVPEEWWPTIREETPAYDGRKTPTRMLGIVAELFRTWPGVTRSEHPHNSVAAIGPSAAAITTGHELESGMGEGSPLARLYELDAFVLLQGVNHANNSSLHLAEHRGTWPGKRTVTEGAPLDSGWTPFESLHYDDKDFEQIGFAFGDRATHGKIGHADAQLMRQRDIVDFGANWMTQNRGRPSPSNPASPPTP